MSPPSTQSLPPELAIKVRAAFSLRDKLQLDSVAKMAQTNVLATNFNNMVKEMQEGERLVEIHEKASIALKELIRNVSTENIQSVETLVNSALASVMPDRQVKFRITPVVRRGLTEYDFELVRPGHEENPGGIETNGGGILALVALVLKLTFNVLAKRAPLIVLDESLSFISEKYILPTSSLIKQISDQFGIVVVLVTHQQLFAESAQTGYILAPQNGESVVKRIK